MDYKKIYDQLIQRGKNRIIEKEQFSEKHHIIPRSMGGNDDLDNIVELTPREHFIAHWLLYRIYPNEKSMIYAFWMMTNRFKNFSSIAYEEARIAHSNNHKGFTHSKETRKLISKKRKLQGNKWKGKIHSEESKSKMSESAKNRNMSEEAKAIRNKRMSESATGVSKTEEHRKNIANSKMGEKNPMYGKKAKQVTCPHCNKTIGVNMASRYHFDNCKLK